LDGSLQGILLRFGQLLRMNSNSPDITLKTLALLQYCGKQCTARLICLQVFLALRILRLFGLLPSLC
jgi:hypothetical protein